MNQIDVRGNRMIAQWRNQQVNISGRQKFVEDTCRQLGKNEGCPACDGPAIFTFDCYFENTVHYKLYCLDRKVCKVGAMVKLSDKIWHIGPLLQVQGIPEQEALGINRVLEIQGRSQYKIT